MMTIQKMSASLRFKTVHFHGDMRTVHENFISGRNTRSESRACDGQEDPATGAVRYEYGPLRAYIHNRDLERSFQLDLEARIYTAARVDKQGSPAWMKPRKAILPQSSGRIVHTHTETVRKSERKDAFGYIARRVIKKTRQTRDGELISESNADEWLITPPAAWLHLYPPEPGFRHVLAAGAGERDEHRFTDEGEPDTGFTVASTQTSLSYRRGEGGEIRTHEHVYQQEITELSELPLAPTLFAPPRDFRRVPLLPGEYRSSFPHWMRLRWEMLKDAIILPNREERFIGSR